MCDKQCEQGQEVRRQICLWSGNRHRLTLRDVDQHLVIEERNADVNGVEHWQIVTVVDGTCDVVFSAVLELALGLDDAKTQLAELKQSVVSDKAARADQENGRIAVCILSEIWQRVSLPPDIAAKVQPLILLSQAVENHVGGQ